jgi:hypothetical protein
VLRHATANAVPFQISISNLYPNTTHEVPQLTVECSVFESELQDVIPICHATIAGTRIVGRLIVG